MASPKKKAGTVAAVPDLSFARSVNRANAVYLQSDIAATDIAARINAARYRLAPSADGTVAKLAGYGRRA